MKIIWYNIGGLQKHAKRPVTKDHIMYDLWNAQNSQIYKDES